MLAIKYISEGFEHGSPLDSKEIISGKMNRQMISEIPIVSNEGVFRGMVNEEGLKSWSDIENSFLDKQHKCFENQNIFEAINLVASNKLSCIPIIKEPDIYIGALTLRGIISAISEFASVQIPGALIVLDMFAQDYSLVEIAEIAESNGCKILSTQVQYIDKNLKARVTIKINTSETSSILQAFRRYGYEIYIHFNGHDMMDSFYQERVEEILKYINM